MAISGTAKFAVSAGIGSLSTILTDSAIQYWGYPGTGTDGKPTWWYKYSSLLGAGVSVAAAGVLWRTWGTDEALVCLITGVGTALAIPARQYVAEQAPLRATGALVPYTPRTVARAA